MTPNLRSVSEVAELFEETWSDFIGDIEFNDAFKHLADDPDVPFVLPEMCKWLRTTLTTDRQSIATVLIEGLEGMKTEHQNYIDSLTPNEMSYENVKYIESKCSIKALDTAIALIRTTLDVTSEEK